jgi:hypothetical protein
MPTTTVPTVPLEDIDLSTIEFWLAPRDWRNGAFKTLRDTPGLTFWPERIVEGYPFPPGPGYYVAARHDDVWHVSRNPHLFCSGQGSNIGDLPQEMNEFFGSMRASCAPRRPRSSTECSTSTRAVSAISSRSSLPPCRSRSSAT